MKRIIIAALLTLAVAFPHVVFSQDIDLEKVVVTASRISQDSGSVARNVDLITSKDIEQSGAQDLSDVLGQLPSLTVSQYGGLGSTKSVRMRGSNASQTLIMLDGRPLNNPRDGEVDLSMLSISINDISRIEVLHGPGSSLYGSNAMGGVINIISKNPPKEGFKTDIISGFGTFRTYLDRISHGGKLAKFGYLISGSYDSTWGYRDNSKLNQKMLNTKITYDFDTQNVFTINSGFFRNLLGTPGSLLMPDSDDKQRTYKNFVDASWDVRLDETMGFNVKMYNTYERLEFIENSASYEKNIHGTISRGVDVQGDKKFSDFYRLLGGFNYVANYNDSTSSGKHAYCVKAWYFDNQIDITKRLFFTLGSRMENYSTFGFTFNPSASVLFKLDEKTKIRSSISRSFRTPTFNDLYWPADPWTSGNPNLKPEKGITGEMGVERQIVSRLNSRITYFHTQYKNMINWAPSGMVWTPSNVDSAQIDGLELLNRFTITDDLNADITYSWQHAKDMRTKKYLIYQPNNKAGVTLNYKLEKMGLLLSVRGEYVDRRFHDVNNIMYVKRFFSFGLSGSKKINQYFSCFASIDNMTNRTYQMVQDYPMPGFSVSGGLKASF